MGIDHYANVDLKTLGTYKLYGRLRWLKDNGGTPEQIEEVEKELQDRGFTKGRISGRGKSWK